MHPHPPPHEDAARGSLHDPRMRPSAYGAALLSVAAAEVERRAGQPLRVLELGTGCGVVLAGLLQAGAASALGVDLEADALRATGLLLEVMGLAPRAELRLGNLWDATAEERFDIVVCNPPQFPSRQHLDDGRLPSWSWGGPEGRAVLDPLLAGLGRHLRPGGTAYVTHNAFLGMERSAALLQAQGLACRSVRCVSELLSAAKAHALPAAFRAAGAGAGLRQVGPHLFAEFHVIEIRHRLAPPLGAPA